MAKTYARDEKSKLDAFLNIVTVEKINLIVQYTNIFIEKKTIRWMFCKRERERLQRLPGKK